MTHDLLGTSGAGSAGFFDQDAAVMDGHLSKAALVADDGPAVIAAGGLPPETARLLWAGDRRRQCRAWVGLTVGGGPVMADAKDKPGSPSQALDHVGHKNT